MQKKKKKLDPDDPDFDSEEEYGNEEGGGSDEDGEEEGEESMSEHEEEEKPKPDYVVRKAAPNEYLIKRESTLVAILQRSFKSRIIIFCNEKLQCSRLFALLTMYGFNACEAHGNMTQGERLQAVEKF